MKIVDLKLGELRDLLLPATYSTQAKFGNDYEADLSCDFQANELVLKVYRKSTKIMVIERLTHQEVADLKFRPKIEAMFNKLKRN